MRHRIQGIVVLLVLAACCTRPASERAAPRDVGPGLTTVDQHTLAGDKSFLDGYSPTNEDGSVNVVVEIPAGTIAKWEVAKPDGKLAWEFKNGRPRNVQYLGYPGNYGMIPRTLLPLEAGGDGDPLDVIVLGPGIPRGTVLQARVIGVLRLLDGGEQDDKILAVLDESPFAAVESIAALDSLFPGVTDIVETWFGNYKGPAEIETRGYAGPEDALAVIEQAAAAFEGQS